MLNFYYPTKEKIIHFVLDHFISPFGSMTNGVVFVLVIVGLSSCLKQENFPNRPDLEFIGIIAAVQPADSLGVIRFNFTDGDGDLGLNPGDTFNEFAPGQPYNFNLFARYFDKQNGEYVEWVPPDSVSAGFNARFIKLSSEGGSGALEGEMDYGFAGRAGAPFDTIRYEIYIVDRALQHSDTIVTPDIILSSF
jgi:hypothetical protein